MFKKEFVEKMKNDEELGDAAYIIGKDKSYEDYKERLRRMVKEHEATGQ